jgi:pyruvate dehydrogenase E1 component
MGGLQSYPSRSKDPIPADFSTGSVGIGATATIWSAIAHRYVAGHFEVPQGGRQVALIGDAELDEGACWEAIVDPLTPRLGEVLWIVDLNRQSLDRIVPEMAAGRLVSMFEAAGWHTVTVKYGSCSGATEARRSGSGSMTCPTRSTSGCFAPTRRSCASGCPAADSPAPRSGG